jgi:formate dehydrogenase major subunit
MTTLNLIIDGRSVVGRPGQTILDVARENGIEIPTLCFDDHLEPYGGCGLCVVELKGSSKLFRACALPKKGTR